MEDIPTPQFLYKAAFTITTILAVLLVTPSLVSIVMIGLMVYAWRGPRQSIEALTLLFLVLNLNQGLFPFWGQGGSLRWLVLFSAFGRLVWDSILSGKRWPLNINALLILYSFVGICLSLLSSRVPAISVFKLIAFCIGAITVVTCFYRTRDQRAYWMSWFYTFFVVLVALSLPLLVLPQGYFVNGRGFQGILIHPQTFGPVLAPMAAGLTVLLLLKKSRSILMISSVWTGLLAIYASQSRTAMLMYVAGLAVAAGLMIYRKEWVERQSKRPVMIPGVRLMMLVALALLLVVKGAEVERAAQDFLLKRAGNQGSLSFQVRTSMVDQQLENFREQPLTGIGFGIPSSEDSWISLSTGFMGIPTGFPVEKGFLPSAALEETGLIGVTLLFVLLCCLAGPVLRRGAIPIIAMLVASFMANVGEMVFFSFGAAGLYYWLLIGFCYNSVKTGES